MKPVVLAYDLGGTKVEVGVVDADGAVIESTRTPVVIEQGKEAVIAQLAELGKSFLSRYPQIDRAGMASAGPLDPARGVLLDPTNFTSAEGSWGQVPLADLLSRRMGCPVFLENDAAAAILAEHWVGAARGVDNAMILTLGTGLGTGLICNGQLMRSGRQLHPEAGHMIINYDDASAVCGCGNAGCAEAYLSGRNFTRRYRARFDHPDVTAKDIAENARQGDERALQMFDEYATAMSAALSSYVAMFAPEIFIFTGSFAAASDLFLEETRKRLEIRIARRRVGIDLMPRLEVSTLDNHAGLIGGAHVAFFRQQTQG